MKYQATIKTMPPLPVELKDALPKGLVFDWLEREGIITMKYLVPDSTAGDPRLNSLSVLDLERTFEKLQHGGYKVRLIGSMVTRLGFILTDSEGCKWYVYCQNDYAPGGQVDPRLLGFIQY